MKVKRKALQFASLGINYGALTIILYTLFSGNAVHSFLIFLAAGIHELGHIVAAALLGIKIKELRLDLIGASLITSGIHSYRDERLLCAAGPFFNLVGILFAYPLQGLFISKAIYPRVAEYLGFFCGACLCLMLINLLPVRGFDGGRILSSLLSEYIGIGFADNTVNFLTLICIGTLWAASIYMIIKYQSALSLFTFSAMLFARLFLKENGGR